MTSLRAGPGGRSVAQKIGQAVAAQVLERRWRKDQILEAYLNLVPFRGELVGIDALSRTLFGKAAHGLDAREAAVAAALVRAPNAARPWWRSAPVACCAMNAAPATRARHQEGGPAGRHRRDCDCALDLFATGACSAAPGRQRRHRTASGAPPAGTGGPATPTAALRQVHPATHRCSVSPCKRCSSTCANCAGATWKTAPSWCWTTPAARCWPGSARPAS
jgi:hypothetical protein